MAKKSITKRWIFNNLGVVVLALLVIDMVIVYAIQNYFYSSAKQYIVSKLNAVTSILSMHSQDSSTNFSSEMRNMLETFNEKDKIELIRENTILENARSSALAAVETYNKPNSQYKIENYIILMEVLLWRKLSILTRLRLTTLR